MQFIYRGVAYEAKIAGTEAPETEQTGTFLGSTYKIKQSSVAKINSSIAECTIAGKRINVLTIQHIDPIRFANGRFSLGKNLSLGKNQGTGCGQGTLAHQKSSLIKTRSFSAINLGVAELRNEWFRLLNHIRFGNGRFSLGKN